MDIGTGIFLGLLTVAIVILYLKTRERWNWRQNATKLLVFIVSAGLSIYVVVEAKAAYANRVVRVTEYMGVKIGESKPNIKFKLGAPAEEAPESWGYKEDGKDWSSVVLFNKDKAQAVVYLGSCTYCHTIYGLGIGNSYDTVIAKLGEPSHVRETADSLSRYHFYKDLNLVVRFERGAVIGLGIYDAALGPIQFDGTQPINIKQ